MVTDFRAGAIIGGALAIIGRRFAAILTLVVVASLPMIAAAVYDASRPADETEETDEFNWRTFARSQNESWLQTLGMLISSSLAAGAVGHYVFDALRGRRVSVGRSLAAMGRRAFPLVGIALASTLLMIVGFILFVVPCFVFAAMVYVSAPACVVE